MRWKLALVSTGVDLNVRSRIGQTLRQIGFANLLWNKLEELWYLYFTLLMQETARSQVDAIYRSHDTGNKKRALISSVASEVLAHDLPLLEVVRERIGRTNDAASTRNALIHADFGIVEDHGVVDLVIASGGSHSKKNRLGGQDLSDELVKFVGSLKTLVNDVEGLLPAEPDRPAGFPGILTTAKFVEILDHALLNEEAGEGHVPDSPG